jgi:tRNA (guanine-N7-)-methyltransferase
MRMRAKPWARPELAACPFYIDVPAENKGRWKNWFPKEQPIHLELGCGKGVFVAQMAQMHPEINYMAVDIKSEVLAEAKRNVEKALAEQGRPVDHVALMSQDIERILDIMDERDQVERIYINFCNPWPTGRHHKRRLTHERQLEHYKVFLRSGGEIHFKTDDSPLFTHSLGYFERSGFEIIERSDDLHHDERFESIQTEHERLFAQQGISIRFLIARRKD